MLRSKQYITYLNLNSRTDTELNKDVTIFFTGFLAILWINVH